MMNKSRKTQHGRVRWLRFLVSLIVILVLVALLTGWALMYGSRPRLSGERILSGLGDAVAVTRDAQGAVTLQAKSRGDIDYALGYVQAQERYFSMDLMRRVAAGELAELVGPAAVDTDLNHRRHRLRKCSVSVRQMRTT